MKTALTELIEWMKDQYYPSMYEDEILEKATQLLEKEKEQIEDAYQKGKYDVLYNQDVPSEQYFNETFEQ